MFLHQSRLILHHAVPMLIAQLATMGMMVIDTTLLGHYGTSDLAAVAVGGGIYVAITFALAGILNAVAPVVAQLKGAGRDTEIAATLQQGFWLALLLAIPGILLLRQPDALLALSRIEPEVEAKARAYLVMHAWGVPAALCYRAFYAFCNALGQPRPLMRISLGATLLHGVLAWLLVNGWDGQAGLGVVGCGISNALVNWFALACGVIYLLRSRTLAPYRLRHGWQPPQRAAMGELMRLGLPMGFSNFVEISAFSLVALLVAQLGATVVAGHRIIANLASVTFMLPLSLSLATLTQVGHAVGARDWSRARQSAIAGMLLAAGLATLLGGLIWLVRNPLVAAASNDHAVRAVALALIVYIAFYQVFDALQTVAAFSLRAYKITFLPMLVHVACFWGVGLFGGWWLAFHGPQPMGVAGFWTGLTLSLILAATLLGGLLWRTMRMRR